MVTAQVASGIQGPGMLGQRAAYAGRAVAEDGHAPRCAEPAGADDGIREAPAAQDARSAPDLPAAPARKWAAGAMSLVLLALVASPVIENWKADPDDDFPLSYYPMFTDDRSDRQRLNYLIGIDDSGNRQLLESQLVGPGGVNQARRQMSKLIGQKRAPQLCRSVASRVADSAKRHKDIVQVEIVTGTFRMSDFFGGSTPSPSSEDVRARCPVLRR
jgi:hypothetical protein